MCSGHLARQDLAMFIYVHIACGLMTGSAEPFLDDEYTFWFIAFLGSLGYYGVIYGGALLGLLKDIIAR